MKRLFPILLVPMALALSGCPDKDKSDRIEDAGRSPTATLRPSPRSSVSPAIPMRDASYDGPVGLPADSRGRLAVRDAQVIEPTPLAPAKPLEGDRLIHRELHGLTLAAEWIWEKVPSPAGGAELDPNGVKEARAATRHLWQIETLENGRIRIVFDSPAFPLTKFTELRSRQDLLGHVLVWPNSEMYRIIPPGALRALLDERRLDVSPLVAETIRKEESSRPRFAFPTRRTWVTTPWGEVQIQQARTPHAGSGGPLLCRLLIELVGASPTSSVCEDGKVPVHAVFSWKEGGKVTFEVTSLLIRTDFQPSTFLVPPPRAKFTDTGLPPDASGILLTREQIAAFRTKGIDVPLERTDSEATGAPGEGFLAVNQTDALRFLIVDGVPVAWVPALGERYLIGTHPGRYNVQWRSFLGTYIGESREVLFPARLSIGAPPNTSDDEEQGPE